ncbi:translation initiation factor IF-2, partial [Candidatus Peregrinibacteria bacterium]|nr:translation initiation factor IF-2 [Candidatus Peregrinibacteria bacterium]
DIHFAAKELGVTLQPTARSVDAKLAKALVKLFGEKEEKSKKVKVEKPKSEAKTSKKKASIEAEKPVQQEKKPKESFKILEKPQRLEKVKEKFRILEPAKPRPKAEPLPFVEEPKVKKEKPVFFEKKVKRDKNKQNKPKVRQDTTVADELLGVKEHQGPRDTAELYDEIIAEEREREIVQSQRKKTAGKDNSKPQIKHAPTISHTVKYDPNRVVEIGEITTVKEFAEKSGLGAAKIIGELMKNGILANINQQIDFDTALIISDDLKVKIKKKQMAASAEDLFAGNLESLLKEHDTSVLQTRPPIVVIMGHVDHGKTKLLDAIRNANVVESEAGGITQHIGAYQVEKNGKKITFLDTPGHEAFTAMRARGARVTDIAVLVVAADEGIKPQTLEALQHAKDAKVPIMVAITKVDKPNADIEKVKGELSAHELIPEEWGGNTVIVPVSAVTGKGIPELLEMILLVAEMANLKANPNREGVATVIEANMDQSLGPVATVIVNTGTLKLMDNMVIGESYGRIKLMKDHHGNKIKSAGPSTPVLIAGLSERAVSGDIVQVVPDEKTARMRAITIKNLRKAQQRERGVGEIISAISSGQLKTLCIVLKADTNGSLEAIKHSISEIRHEDVGVKVILSGVGDVNESDVMMAAASGAIVMGFSVRANQNVMSVAERENVEVIHYDIIYKLLDDVKKILTGLLEPEFVEVILGEVVVKQIFYSKKKEMIIGCMVKSGVVQNKVKVRVKRGEEIVGEVQITSLQKNMDSVSEVKEGAECGLKVSGGVKIEEGDVLIPYRIDKKIRTL